MLNSKGEPAMFNTRGIHRILPACCTIVCLMLAPVACARVSSDSNAYPLDLYSPASGTEIVVVSSASIVGYSDTYKELIEKSDLIVIGTAVDTGMTFNGARNSVHPEEADDDIYDLVKIYEVKVERYLKGSGPETVLVVKAVASAYGTTAEEVQLKVESNDFDERYQSFEMDKPYLLFLKKHRYIDSYLEVPKGEYYHWATVPWIFDISNKQAIQIVDDEGSNSQYNFMLPLDRVIEYIQNPELIPPTPTPIIEPTESEKYPYP